MRPGHSLLLMIAAFVCFAAAAPAVAQDSQDDQPHITPRVDPNAPPKKQPRSADKAEKNTAKPAEQPEPEATPQSQPMEDVERGDSSSKDSQIDLNARPLAPAGGSKTAEDPNSYPYDPHRAEKDVEVGNYYLKQKNYRAALDRFHDALLYKPNDADAIYGLAVTQERLDLTDQAYKSYSKYVEVLPHGPMVKEAQEAMKRLSAYDDAAPAPTGNPQGSAQAERALQQGENFLAQNDYEAARIRFEQAMRLMPENPLLYFRLAQALQGEQRLDPARMYYRKYLELQPKGQFAADAKKSIEQINWVLGK